ncbi:MAG: ABC transporter permease [Deltaproteobacteria bacterium]|nr:ABC transporter permease [Deltaproteobacteria bacterium]
MTTIYILWLRQLKRFFRSRSRVLGSVAQPLLFLIALGFGFGPIYQRAGRGNFMEFLAPGIISMTILFSSVFNGIEIIWDRQFGFLKETLVAPVSRMGIMLGRTAGGATVSLLQALLVFVLSMAVGFRPASWGNLPLALVFMVLIAVLFTAMGTAIASLLEDFQGFQVIMNFLVQPLFFLSGALFPLEGLPKALGIVARVDLLSYGVDGLRATLAGISYFGLGTDLVVLMLASLVVLAVGSYLFSKIQI